MQMLLIALEFPRWLRLLSCPLRSASCLLDSSPLAPHLNPNPTWPTQTVLSRASLRLVLVLAQCPGLPTAPPVAPFELLTVPQICGATFAPRPWQVLLPQCPAPSGETLYSFSLRSACDD